MIEPAVLITVPPDLQTFAKEVFQLAIDKGWYNKARKLHEQTFLAAGELHEAGEEYRSGHPLQHIYPKGQSNVTYAADPMVVAGVAVKPEGFPMEVADCLIRLLDFAASRDINIDDAVSEVLWQLRSDQETLYEEPHKSSKDLESDLLDEVLRCNAALAAGDPIPYLAGAQRSIQQTDEMELWTPYEFGLKDEPHLLTEYERYKWTLGRAVVLLFGLADGVGFDLMAMARVKHAYNQTRPHRHGGKVI